MAFLAQLLASQLNGVDAASLSPLQRILLANDGTLTDVLQAAFLEPIVLVKLAADISTTPHPELTLEAGERVMDRKIVLRGGSSGQNYVYAESWLAIDRLPAAFRDALLDSDTPLGRLWSEHRLETWKEILNVERRPAGELAAYFGLEPEEELLARRYRVFSGGRPVMIIAEYFPVSY